ncbi:hypothetical protein SBRCBS47491_008436 [Sporothrix bragantina]|uniref:Putative transcription factor kapC n=1 Tax=Sporothrix bragantina TaxID=671064 RepID=A0ABP0CLG1_9PEZI
MVGARRVVTKAVAEPIDDTAHIAPPHFDDFNAEASLLALQKHVDAVANGTVDTNTAPTAAATQQSPSVLLPHGALASNSIAYAASAALLAARAVDASEPLTSSSHSEAQIHPDLRSALSPLEPPQSQSHYPPLAPTAMSSAVSPSAPVAQIAAPPPPQAAPVAVPPQPISPKPVTDEPAPDVVTDGRRGPRRELSTSKRAAQNRAAQRAFRQRKEGYIKKLEKQVQDYAEMENSYKITQSENYALREYIIHLQSRLLDAKAELPQPPANLNLAAPGMPPILGIGPPPATLAQQQQRHEQQYQQQMQLQQQAALEQQEQQRQLQHLQELEQQKASASPAAQEASALAPVESPPAVTESPATPPSDIKNESSLARVAQAVAQLGNSEAASNGAKEDTNGTNGTNGKAETENGGDGEPMDTTDEAITQNLQKLSEPVASM